MAAQTATAVRLPRALDARGRWIAPSVGTAGLCPDCGEKVTSIISDHYRPHFRHVSGAGHIHHGATGMTQEHHDAQGAVIALFDGFDPRWETTDGNSGRRADVLITYRGQNVVIEVQRSNMRLDEMEARTRDWNDAGAAVLWVFTSSMVTIGGDGNAKLASTAHNWVTRRGWRQCYVVDDDGTLWWIDLRPARHTARPISRGMRSSTGKEATLVVDRNTSGGTRPLIVAAFGWKRPGFRISPLGKQVPNWTKFSFERYEHDTTPERIAR